MKLAITGVNGFIGRSLIKEVLKLSPDFEIICLVRNIESGSSNNNGCIKFLELDIHKPPEDIFEYIGSPDVLIHLAWEGLPNYNSLHHFESELPAQYNFLSSIIKGGLESLFVAGTCFEYGMQSGELSEDAQLVPNNPYGFAKNVLRQKLQYLQSTKSFNLTWGRLFYMYGDEQSGRAIFAQLKEGICNGKSVFNMSGGEQLRDYLEVTEVVNYILRLSIIEKDVGPVNICSGKPVSIRSLVESWLDKYSWDIELNLGFYEYAPYEPMAFWGSRKKLITILESENDK